MCKWRDHQRFFDDKTNFFPSTTDTRGCSWFCRGDQLWILSNDWNDVRMSVERQDGSYLLSLQVSSQIQIEIFDFAEQHWQDPVRWWTRRIDSWGWMFGFIWVTFFICDTTGAAVVTVDARGILYAAEIKDHWLRYRNEQTNIVIWPSLKLLFWWLVYYLLISSLVLLVLAVEQDQFVWEYWIRTLITSLVEHWSSYRGGLAPWNFWLACMIFWE